MFILGLTGSIGMGKSATAKAFARLGLPVYDADAAVHALMTKGGSAVAEVERAFPGVVKDGAVDRISLGQQVFGDDKALRRLEKILHPKARETQRQFLKQNARAGTRAVVLDVPLLYESGSERHCDAVVVVSAPFREQRRRVLLRPGMTERKFLDILKRQTSDAFKRRSADFIVPTGLGHAYALREIRRIATIARGSVGRRWPPFNLPKLRTGKSRRARNRS